MSTAKASAGPDQTFDYFTPYNEKPMSDADVDIGSGGLFLADLPGTPVRHVVIGTGKEGYYYVMDRDDMGKFDPKTDNVLQKFGKKRGQEVMATPIFFNNTFFSNKNGGNLRANAFSRWPLCRYVHSLGDEAWFARRRPEYFRRRNQERHRLDAE